MHGGGHGGRQEAEKRSEGQGVAKAQASRSCLTVNDVAHAVDGAARPAGQSAGYREKMIGGREQRRTKR